MANFLAEVHARIRSVAPNLGIKAAEIEAAMKQKGRGRMGPLLDFADRHELSLNYLLLGEGPPQRARHYDECPSCGSKNKQARWGCCGSTEAKSTSGHSGSARLNSDCACIAPSPSAAGLFVTLGKVDGESLGPFRAGWEDIMKKLFVRCRSSRYARSAGTAVTFPSLTTIYVGSGVYDSGGGAHLGSATTFHCSNVSGVTATIRFHVLNSGEASQPVLRTDHPRHDIQFRRTSQQL